MIGTRIKRLRKERGMTQSELGRGIISISYISQIENNKIEVPDYLLPEIAKRLNVSIDYLLGTHDLAEMEKIRNQLDELIDAVYRNRLTFVNERLDDIKNQIKEISLEDGLKFELTLLEMLMDLHMNKLEIAEKRIDQLKDVKLRDFPLLFYRLLRILGVIRYKKGLYIQALEYFKQASELEGQLYVTTADHAYLVYNKALCYWRLKNFQRSLMYLQDAIGKFTELGNWYGLSESFILQGVLYYQQSHYEKSLEIFKKALAITQEFAEKYLQAKIFHNIGLVYGKQKNYDEAFLYWNKALNLKREMGLTKELSTTLLSMCEIFYAKEDYVQFKHHIDQLNELIRQEENPLVEGQSLQLLGKYHKNRNELSQYKSCYLQAIERYKKGKLFLEAAETSFELASHFNDLRLFRQAAELYYLHQDQLKQI